MKEIYLTWKYIIKLQSQQKQLENINFVRISTKIEREEIIK